MKKWLARTAFLSAVLTGICSLPAQAKPEPGRYASAGLNLAYLREGSGPLVILLHGFADFSFTWQRQMTALAPKYLVVAPDLRGFNRSAKPASVEDYRLERLSQDLVNLMRHLGRDKAILIGHDFGAMVAWDFAFRHPELTDRIAVLGLPHPNDFFRFFAGQKTGGQTPYFESYLSPAAAPSPAELLSWVPRRKQREYAEAMKRSSVQSMLNLYRANIPSDWTEHPGRYPAATRPVLALSGGADPWVPAETFANPSHWTSSVLRWVNLPAGGHDLHVEFPDRINEELLKWCAH